MGCAVNCDNKGAYIEAIMTMEEEDQRVIMQAIQELMELQVAQSEPSLPALSPSDVKKMLDELGESKKEKEELKQKLHDMEQHVNAVKNEKASVDTELEQLQAQVSE
jgi:DNA repair exonuclease SbcCD ATPase subunit